MPGRSRRRPRAVSLMSAVLAALGAALGPWIAIEILAAMGGARCDCTHRWASAIGDSVLRADGGRRYACLRCHRVLTRSNDEWPPRCIDRKGCPRDCAWPLCQPIRGFGDLPLRGAQLLRPSSGTVWMVRNDDRRGVPDASIPPSGLATASRTERTYVAELAASTYPPRWLPPGDDAITRSLGWRWS